MTGVTRALAQPLPPEDAARADFYALLARLYAAGPDTALLQALAAAAPWPEVPEQPLAAAWNRLVAASVAMDAEAAVEEYNEAFVGVGKSPVDLHASHWLTGFMMEKPLAELRTDLAELGLARRPGVTMVEDHLAALCETMRVLIAGTPEGRAPVSLAEQRAFFERRIAPWAFDCCNAITKCPVVNYYRRVGEFTSLFLAVERDSLAIE